MKRTIVRNDLQSIDYKSVNVNFVGEELKGNRTLISAQSSDFQYIKNISTTEIKWSYNFEHKKKSLIINQLATFIIVS